MGKGQRGGKSNTNNMKSKKADSKCTWQVKNQVSIIFGDDWSKEEKRCNKIRVVLKKMRKNDHINQLQSPLWCIDWLQQENQLFCSRLSGEDDNNKNSIASPSMDKDRERATIHQFLPMVHLT